MTIRLSCAVEIEMKSLVFILLVAASAISADDNIVMPEFHSQGIIPTINNGTVSEHIPYMASIRLFSEELNKIFGYGHFCAGVFITRKHVLTVATCMNRERVILPVELRIVAGTRYRYDDAEAKVSTVEKLVIHPDYSIASIPNNIAVIFVSFPLSFLWQLNQ